MDQKPLIEIKYTLSEAAQRAELGEGRPAHRERSVFVEPTPGLAKIAKIDAQGKAVIYMESNTCSYAEEVLTPEKAITWVLLWHMKIETEKRLEKEQKEALLDESRSLFTLKPEVATLDQIERASNLYPKLPQPEYNDLLLWRNIAQAIRAIDAVLEADAEMLKLDPTSGVADIVDLADEHSCKLWDGRTYVLPKLNDSRAELWARREAWIQARNAARKQREVEAKEAKKREESQRNQDACTWLAASTNDELPSELRRAGKENRLVRSALTRLVEELVRTYCEEQGFGHVVEDHYAAETRQDVPSENAYELFDRLRNHASAISAEALLPDIVLEIGPISRIDIAPAGDAVWRTGVVLTLTHPWLTKSITIPILAPDESPEIED